MVSLSVNLIFMLIFASCGCCIKLLQTRWFETTEIYSLTVLKARNVNSACWPGCAPSRGSRGDFVLCLFQLRVVADIPWLVVAPSDLCLCLHMASSFVCLLFCLLQGHLSWDLDRRSSRMVSSRDP